jgi:hypothetical protein
MPAIFREEKMEKEVWYASYLVRVWRQEHGRLPGEPPIWQAEVVHIQSGEKITFHVREQLLHYLEERSDQAPGTSRPS